MSRCVRVLRRPLGVVLIPLVALGCYTWQTATVTPQVLVETEHPKAVRVTTVDSTRQELKAPRIATDTLRGSVHRLVQDTGGVRRWRDSTVAIALRDVTRVEVQRLHGVGTAAAIAATVAAFVLLLDMLKTADQIGNWAGP